MGLVFEEDKAKGQVVVADFVEGSEAEKRNKVSRRLPEQCLLNKSMLQVRSTRLLRCLLGLHYALAVLKHKPAVCVLVMRRHERACSHTGLHRCSILTLLGCTAGL